MAAKKAATARATKDDEAKAPKAKALAKGKAGKEKAPAEETAKEEASPKKAKKGAKEKVVTGEKPAVKKKGAKGKAPVDEAPPPEADEEESVAEGEDEGDEAAEAPAAAPAPAAPEQAKAAPEVKEAAPAQQPAAPVAAAPSAAPTEPAPAAPTLTVVRSEPAAEAPKPAMPKVILPKFVPVLVPAPKPAAPQPEVPVSELPTPGAPPTWVTEVAAADQLPNPTTLETKFELKAPGLTADGTAVGVEAGKVSGAKVMKVRPDGTRVALSEPGQFSSATLSVDGKQVYAVSGDGKVWEFPVSADASIAVVRFQAVGAVWGFTPLSKTRGVVSQEGVVHLVDLTTSPWTKLQSLSVKPITLPLVDAAREGRWVVVGRSPKIHLFALVKDRLQLVQSWVRTEGGATALGGRLFTYTAGSTERLELKNLDEVYATLA